MPDTSSNNINDAYKSNLPASIGNVELELFSVTPEFLTLALVKENEYIAAIDVTRMKTGVKVTLEFIEENDDEEKIYEYRCRLREGEEVTPQCFTELAKDIDEKYLGAGEKTAEALAKTIKEWDSLLARTRLKDAKEMIKAGVKPALEIVTPEGDIVDVLSSDGAVLDIHGGFLDLGNCVVVAESTVAFTRWRRIRGSNGNPSMVMPSIVGLAVTYCYDGEILKLKETRWFSQFQTNLALANRMIRLSSGGKTQVDKRQQTFPDIETLKAVAEGKPIEADWKSVGDAIIEKLKDYIIFTDERLYSVIASYIVMTYFHDFFTAVPFLYFHGPAGSGKTRANTTTTFMCRHGIFVTTPSEAAIYRLADALGPTIGIDESRLSDNAKLILAASYKKGAVVPRAEPTKGGIVLKLFESTAPRVFSFTELPHEDFLLQRIIPINMIKSRPRKEYDPQPNHFKEIREKLYYLRLTRVPEILETMKKATDELKQHDVWGRDLEIWSPVYTASLLIGRSQEVLPYILEDVARRRESELIYAEEKLVLYAIDQLFAETSEPLTGTEKIGEFTASDLQEKIVNKLLEEENCLEVKTDETGVEKWGPKAEAKCQKMYADLVKAWSPQKIGRVLEKLGFDKYKKTVGKGSKAKKKYIIKWSDYEKIARAYDYEPSANKQQPATAEGGESTNEL